MSKEPNNIRIVPSELRYKGAPTEDVSLQVSLNGDRRTLVDGDRTVLINAAERFNEERQKSSVFRVTGKINNIFNNTITGSTNYTPFKNDLYYVNEVNSVSTNVWRGYPQFSEFTFFRTSGIDGHQDFVSKSAFTYNWTTYLSYAFENVTAQTMTYYNEEFSASTIFQASDGVPFVINKTKYNGKPLITFYCGTKHNLSQGEYVKLSFNYNGERYFQVYQLGDENYGSEEKIFSIIDLGYTGTTFDDGVVGTFKRVINRSNTGETTSEYYVRRHKILTSVKDYNLTRMGFENNAFNNEKKLEYSALTPNNVQRLSVKNGSQSFGFTFEKDIDISQYKDNQNRPLTELFVTIINKGFMGWFNKPYQNNTTALNIGWDFNFLSDLIDPWWSQTNSSNKDNLGVSSYQVNNKTFYYNKDLNVGDELLGDFCEWNDYEMKEVAISPMVHKYNYNSVHFQTGSNPQLPLGYMYYPHYKVQTRTFSNYVETAIEGEVDNIPDYSFYSDFDGKWRWRDLYSYGYIDEEGVGVDHPFLNNSHYPFTNIMFLQTPPRRNLNQKVTGIIQPLNDDCE
jgi:hypothetical protein